MVITGMVQGVGFRYRAHHLADRLGVTGWVRNEWNGSVVLEVQGTQEAINELLRQINRGTYVSIDDIRHTRMPVDGQERSFHVR
jgi:acylphosphatase